MHESMSMIFLLYFYFFSYFELPLVVNTHSLNTKKHHRGKKHAECANATRSRAYEGCTQNISWCLCAQQFFFFVFHSIPFLPDHVCYLLSFNMCICAALLPDGIRSPIRKTQTTERNERRTNPTLKKCERTAQKKRKEEENEEPFIMRFFNARTVHQMGWGKTIASPLRCINIYNFFSVLLRYNPHQGKRTKFKDV